MKRPLKTQISQYSTVQYSAVQDALPRCSVSYRLQAKNMGRPVCHAQRANFCPEKTFLQPLSSLVGQ